MNSEQDKAIAFRQEEMRRLGGEDAYRRHALNHLKLKTVVKVRPSARQASVPPRG